MRKFNFYTPTQYNCEAKRRFHATARVRLRTLANTLDLDLNIKSTSQVYSNMGGVAVSGEVCLKTPTFAVEASQPAFSPYDAGLRIYRLNPEGNNFFAPLEYLNNIPLFANHIQMWLANRPHPFARVPVELPRLFSLISNR